MKGLAGNGVFIDMYKQIPDAELLIGKTYCYREKGFVAVMRVLSIQNDDEYFRVKLFAQKYFNLNGEALVCNPFFYGYNKTLNVAISKSYFYPKEFYLHEIEKCKNYRY